MSLPDVSIDILDGALGLVVAGALAMAVIGVCSSGTVNEVVAVSSKSDLVSKFGTGPAVEAAALALDVAGGPILMCRINGSVAGSVGTVSVTGTGPANNVAFTGTPLDAYEIAVEILTGGARGTATFRYALDANNPAGPTWSDAIATAATYALSGTGLTLTFASATYVAEDLYRADCVAPGYSSTDVQNAFAALFADPRRWRFVHLVGQASTAAGAATIASALDTLMTSAEASARYAWALMAAPSDSDANLLAAFASFSSTRVAVAAGFAKQASPINGRVSTRSVAQVIAAHIASQRLSEDAGRVRGGALKGIVSVSRDEQVTPGLDARFAVLRSIVGKTGYFVSTGRIMAASGSDFSLVQYRQVMDEGCTVARAALLEYVNESVRVNVSGTIFELDARAIEADVRASLSDALLSPGHASAVSVQVDRTNNVLSTQKLIGKLRIRPNGYLKDIEVDIGFDNPKLALS